MPCDLLRLGSHILGGVLVALGVAYLTGECQSHRRMPREIIRSAAAPVSFVMQAAWQTKLAAVGGCSKVRTWRLALTDAWQFHIVY